MLFNKSKWVKQTSTETYDDLLNFKTKVMQARGGYQSPSASGDLDYPTVDFDVDDDGNVSVSYGGTKYRHHKSK